MRLYLVRHGDALPKEADPERGLSDEGRIEAGKVAAFLKGLGIAVEAVWQSGKKRAAQTAEIMASAVHAKGGLVHRAGMTPMDPVAPIADMVEALEGDCMLVGHLPFLSTLASRLLLGREEPDVVGLPAAAVVCLTRGSSGRWTVSWMVTPDIL